MVSSVSPLRQTLADFLENFEKITHNFKQIKASIKKPINVYSDANMSDVLDTFTSSKKIKAIKVTDEVYAVLYEKDGIETLGYVYEKDFVDPTKNTVRNAIIIIIVTLSVAVTSIYFILRKKDNVL